MYAFKISNAVVFASLALAACANDLPGPAAPESIAYPKSPFLLVAGKALEPQTPVVVGGAPTEYTVSPPLPAGLTLDAETGVLSGTPTAEAALKSHLIVGSNAAGSAAANISLGVTSTGEAPTMLDYPVKDVAYLRNMAVMPNTPTVQGTKPMVFTVAPSLPAGLSLNADTGTISGTPTTTTARETFIVTAANAKGKATAVINIAVTDTLAPPGLTGYTTDNALYAVGQAIAPNSPIITGTPPFTFTVDKPLPSGLSLSASDGKITGTPTAATAQAVFTVTATNPAGSSTCTLKLTVNATATFSYPSTKFVFVTPGTGIPAIAPSLLPGNLEPLTVSPTLPAGLSLDAATGVISGAPSRNGALTESVFTVTATDKTTKAAATATVTIELLDPKLPGQAAGVRGPNGGTMKPVGPAGAVTNGLLVDVFDSNDNGACVGNSLTPQSAMLGRGDSVSFRLAASTSFGWAVRIQQSGPASDPWPAIPCLLLGSSGDTCTFGINRAGASHSYTNNHQVGSPCPDPGAFTVP